MRFRQIHMDFHTSEQIAGVGSAFDPEAFADTLARAHVDSVTCFARCHHGWIYYDTAVHPERRHPAPRARPAAASRSRRATRADIRVPIYTTVQWDHLTAGEHPEWRVITPEGALEGTPPFEAGFYRKLCLNSPYVELLEAHTRDLQATLPVDGLFFDIVQATECVCRWCQAGMGEQGLDPEDPAAREAYAVATLDRFRTRMSAFVREVTPDGDDLLQRRPRRTRGAPGGRRVHALRARVPAERLLGLPALPRDRSATRARWGATRSGTPASSTPRGATSTRSRTARRWSTSASGCWRWGRSA